MCECSITWLCLTLCDPMDCSLPGSSVHGIILARILEQVSISFSRGSFWPRDWSYISCVSCIGRRILYHWAISEAPSFIIRSVNCSFFQVVFSFRFWPWGRSQPPQDLLDWTWTCCWRGLHLVGMREPSQVVSRKSEGIGDGEMRPWSSGPATPLNRGQVQALEGSVKLTLWGRINTSGTPDLCLNRSMASVKKVVK